MNTDIRIDKTSHLLAGTASVMAGMCFLFGMIVYITVFSFGSYGDIGKSIAPQLTLMSTYSALMYLWYFVIYIVFGVALMVFQIAIKPHLQTGWFASIALVFGYFWSGLTIASGMLANIGTHMVLELMGVSQELAISLWYTLQMLINGIGGGNELVGGIWLLLLGLSYKADLIIERWLRVVAIVFGGIGLFTAVPILTDLGEIFGIGSMVWFLVMGCYQLGRYRGEKAYV